LIVDCGSWIVEGSIAALIALAIPASHSLADGPTRTRPANSAVATRPATGPAASQPHIVQFQPGIRINWTQRQVEIEVTVVLREGPIELFASCPRQREYESIVRIEARPTHLYQALGLIGLTPGHPDRFDEQGRFVPASGDFVDVEVRYPGADGQTRQEPIETWMKPAEGDASLGRLPWVFAGSTPLEDGKGIASDLEGTVVALVEFSSSLIALPEYHSESNTELWLRPRSERIPPLGTKCRLIIRAAPLRLRLETGGKLRIGERTITRAELARTVSERVKADAGLRVEIAVARGAEELEVKSLVQLLRGLDIRESGIEIFTESGEQRPIMR
jgi:hypothetical protein